jgi:hypothetical protein
MGDNIKEGVEIAFDSKIKPPASINSSLPDTPSLIVFFGVQRRMAEIP